MDGLGEVIRHERADHRKEIAALETRVSALEVQVDADAKIRGMLDAATAKVDSRTAQLDRLEACMNAIEKRLDELSERPPVPIPSLRRVQ